MTTAWKLIPHHLDRFTALDWTKKNKRLAIGWGFTGDLNSAKYAQPTAISNTIKEAYLNGTHPYKNYGKGSLSLWSLVHEVQIGDMVIFCGAKGGRAFVAQVTGNYDYNPHLTPTLGNYFHHRKIEITELDPDKLWLQAGGKIEKGRNPQAILARCAKKI